MDSQRPSSTSGSGGLPRPILFFDGDCGLCDRLVTFLVGRDRRGALHYAPLQGPTAKASLPPELAGSMDTAILLDGEGWHVRSEAALRAIAALGGPWGWIGLLRAVPRRLRDLAYDYVARNRYHWFGGAAVCPLPGRAAKGRFLP